MPDHREHSVALTTIRAHRVIAALNREQLDFLDKIGKDALFSCGVKLSRTHILSAMVNVLRRLNLTGEGIRSPEQFEQRIIETVAKSKGGRVRSQLPEQSERRLSDRT